MRTLLSALLALVLTCSCFSGGHTPELAQSWDVLASRKAEVEAELERPMAPERRAVLEAEVKQIDAGFAEIRSRALNDAVGPVVAAVAATTGPVGATLLPLIPALLPLLGRRGRMHYASAVKNITPWVPDENGETGVALADAARDVLRALGVLHTERPLQT